MPVPTTPPQRVSRTSSNTVLANGNVGDTALPAVSDLTTNRSASRIVTTFTEGGDRCTEVGDIPALVARTPTTVAADVEPGRNPPSRPRCRARQTHVDRTSES